MRDIIRQTSAGAPTRESSSLAAGTEYKPAKAASAFAATIPTLDFQPSVPSNYAETVLPRKDGLPKLKEFPAEFGGSGQAIAV